MSARRSLKWTIAMSWVAVCGLVLVGIANAAGLPDGRVYERVSSLAKYGSEVYSPGEGTALNPTVEETRLPLQASASGDRVVFAGGLSEGGNELAGLNYGNEYLGIRSAGGGWSQSNISPVGYPEGLLEAFSSDLTVGFLDSDEPMSSAAPGFGESPPEQLRTGNYEVLYSTRLRSGEYVPFFTARPPYRSIETFGTAALTVPFSGDATLGRYLLFLGASADSSHALFMANDALTGASEGRPAAEGGSEATFETENNLYESASGQLRLVNVLPDGTTHANASFGGRPPLGRGSDGWLPFSHVISNDGSRIFWTDLETGHIYVRENGARTVEISPAGHYQTASSDGAEVFYTNGDLYQYELETGNTTDLTPGVPVERVVGASEDGKYVYYLTMSGEFKLWHDGVTTAIGAFPVERGEVTPDGHSVVFVYANESSEPSYPGLVGVYDADTNSVYCASCTSSGTRGVLPKTNVENVYQPRWISADGSRVFFESNEALVPQDTNGELDVYEWERPGSGGCAKSTGCVYLLSGGSSDDASFFADASESGDDVFIVTRAKLLDSDEDELYDLYDVRVNGFVPVTPPACTGSGCQGVPGAPPIFATPSSVTFEGVGNFAAPVREAAVKSKQHRKHTAKKKKKKKKKKKSKVKKSAHRAVARKRSGAKGGRS